MYETVTLKIPTSSIIIESWDKIEVKSYHNPTLKEVMVLPEPLITAQIFFGLLSTHLLVSKYLNFMFMFRPLLLMIFCVQLFWSAVLDVSSILKY